MEIDLKSIVKNMCGCDDDHEVGAADQACGPVLDTLAAALPLIEDAIADVLDSIDGNEWAWRGMDVNTGTSVAEFIRRGYVLDELPATQPTGNE